MARREGADSLREIFTRDFLLLATINLAMFFGFQMINVGIPVYVAQLGAGAQTVGLVTTALTVTAVVVRIFAGPLLDRFGRKGALVGGTLIMVCSIFAYAAFPVVGIILGLRLLHGLGWGLGSTASSTIAADVIPKRRFAEGMGYFAMTNAVSSALAPAVSIALVQGPGALYMLYVAGGCTALAFVIALFQRDTAKLKNAGGPVDAAEKAQSRASVETSGAGATKAEASRAETAKAEADKAETAKAETFRPDAVKPAKAIEQPTGISAVFERRALLPGMLMLLVNIGFGSITAFITLHGLEQGIEQVAAYFMVYAVVTLASRPLIGRLIDRYGYRMPSILATLFTAATLVLIGLSRNVWMISFAGALAGLGIGTAMGTFQAMAVASVEPWRRGVATSTYMTAFDLGIAIGSLIGGIIAGAWGYTVMYTTIAAFPLLASLLSAILVKRRL